MASDNGAKKEMYPMLDVKLHLPGGLLEVIYTVEHPSIDVHSPLAIGTAGNVYGPGSVGAGVYEKLYGEGNAGPLEPLLSHLAVGPSTRLPYGGIAQLKSGCTLGVKMVMINGQKCSFDFTQDSSNGQVAGLLKIYYKENTYTLTCQLRNQQDNNLDWCLHLPTAPRDSRPPPQISRNLRSVNHETYVQRQELQDNIHTVENIHGYNRESLIVGSIMGGLLIMILICIILLIKRCVKKNKSSTSHAELKGNHEKKHKLTENARKPVHKEIFGESKGNLLDIDVSKHTARQGEGQIPNTSRNSIVNLMNKDTQLSDDLFEQEEITAIAATNGLDE